MSNTSVDLNKIKRRVKVIRERLRTIGPCHTDTADLLDYVEQLAMLYQASQDALGETMAEHRKAVSK